MTAVMAPYRRGRAGRRVRPLATLLLLAYCAGTGAVVALLPPQLMLMLMVPIIVGVGLILWMLPDRSFLPERTISFWFGAFLVTNCLWPNYIALDLPGLPWINPPRIAALILLTISVVTYATSAEMRRDIADVLRSIPILNALFWIFWGISLVTIVMAGNAVFFSFNKWINNQIFWTFLFLLSAWCSMRTGVITRFVYVLLWSAIILSLLSLYEYKVQQLPWINSIPSFLSIDGDFIKEILSSQMRAGTDIYRVHGTFSVSLILAEYLVLVLPFLLHAFVVEQQFWNRLLLSLAFSAISATVYLTHARLGVIGFFISLFFYGALAIVRYRRQHSNSIISVGILSALPVAVLAFLGLSLTWTRLHNLTFGGGEHEGSSLARAEQWALGLPKFFANPIGYGAGRGGEILQYFSPGGKGTIDSYYLSLLLEYGIFGFIAFLLLFIVPLGYGVSRFLKADEGEELLVGPATVALANFIVIRAVLSEEFNVKLAFILLGFVFGIAWRQNARLSSAIQYSKSSRPEISRSAV